jgi:hypothetical protein
MVLMLFLWLIHMHLPDTVRGHSTTRYLFLCLLQGAVEVLVDMAMLMP